MMDEDEWLERWKKRAEENKPSSDKMKSEVGIRNGSTAGVGR